MSLEIEVVDVEESSYLGIREVADVSAIPTKMGELYGELFAFVGRKGIQPAGPPFAIYHSFSPPNTDLECAIPVIAPVEGEGRVKAGKLPPGKALRAMHIGPYDRLHETYNFMSAYAKEKNLKLSELVWEYYLTDPNTEPDSSKWRTEIFLQVL